MAAPKGNKYAAKAKVWELAIRRALARLGNGTTEKGLAILADKLVAAAREGDSWAMMEIGNRLDGKPHQSVALSGSLNLNNAAQLSDDELAHIATGGSLGTADEATGEDDASAVH